MSAWDWIVTVGIVLACLLGASLAVLIGWAFGQTLGEIRQTDREVQQELRRRWRKP